MAVSITCTKTVRQNGRAYIRFNDKSELEFSSIAEAVRYVRSVLDKDVLKAILIAKALEASPDGSALASLEGRTCTADLTLAANVVRVT